MIQYLYQEGQKTCEKEPLKVRVDGRITGQIEKVEGGYRYFAKGCRIGGDIFPSVTLVQRSLNE